jgi:alpha-maltose-1-phosphate synthase
MDPNGGLVTILLLCEGNAETRDSWSGTSKSLVDSLRAVGHTVYCGDVDLYGITRVAVLAATWAPTRFRWWARYHLGAVPFEFRSRRAQKHIRAYKGRIDLILQIGATFEPRGRGTIPYVLYCDGNARFAERGQTGGQAEVTALTPAELADTIDRECSVYGSASAVMTLSEVLRQSFIEDFGKPEDRTVTVGAGPNFDPAEALGIEVTAAKQPTILFVGRSFERKGGDLLLSAFSTVREHVPDAQLVIAGPSNLDIAGPGIRLLGSLRKEVPEEWAVLRDAYSGASVFCLPTRFEPFGLVFVEAMFFGLPCVGPDSWAVPEIIVSEETGILVPPGDEAALAEALITLLQAPEQARQMGRAGRARAIQRLGWDAVAARVDAVLDLVVVETARVGR